MLVTAQVNWGAEAVMPAVGGVELPVISMLAEPVQPLAAVVVMIYVPAVVTDVTPSVAPLLQR